MRIHSFRVSLKHHRIVYISLLGQRVVAIPPIGSYHISFSYVVAHKPRKRFRGSICNMTKAQATRIKRGPRLFLVISGARTYFESANHEFFVVDTPSFPPEFDRL